MEWINIEERRPPADGDYLICVRYPADVKLQIMASYIGGRWFLLDYYDHAVAEEFQETDTVKITHWCSVVDPD